MAQRNLPLILVVDDDHAHRMMLPLLAQHFLKRLAERNHKAVKGISPRAMDLLLRYSWPGNIRELENVMERAIILLQGEYVSERELPMALQELVQATMVCADVNAPEEPRSDATLADRERQIIYQILEETGGNKSETARRLGITRRTLKLKLKKYAEDAAGSG